MKQIFRHILRITRNAFGSVGVAQHVERFSIPLTDHRSLLFQMIQRTVIILSVVDGQIKREEIYAAQKLYKVIFGTELDLGIFYDDVENMDLWIQSYWSSLDQAKLFLSNHEIEVILSVAIMMASADLEFGSNGYEQDTISLIAQKLNYKDIDSLIEKLVCDVKNVA